MCALKEAVFATLNIDLEEGYISNAVHRSIAI